MAAEPISSDARLRTVEQSIARIDAVLQTLASKSDLVDAESKIIKWVVGTAGVIAAGAITVMTFVLNNAVPKVPAIAAQPPIVIVVPTGADPAKAALSSPKDLK